LINSERERERERERDEAEEVPKKNLVGIPERRESPKRGE